MGQCTFRQPGAASKGPTASAQSKTRHLVRSPVTQTNRRFIRRSQRTGSFYLDGVRGLWAEARLNQEEVICDATALEKELIAQGSNHGDRGAARMSALESWKVRHRVL